MADKATNVGIWTAIIVAIVSSATTYSIQKMSVDQQKAQALQAAQQAHETVQQAHEAWMLDHIDQVNAANAKLAESTKGHYYSIGFKNSCNEEIHIAVRYKALDGSPMMAGWATYNPKEEGVLHGDNTNINEFEYYAHSENHDWQGDDSVSEVVSNSPFLCILDSRYRLGWLRLPDDNNRRVNFVTEIIPFKTPFGPYQVTISCGDASK